MTAAYDNKDLADAQPGDQIAWTKMLPSGTEITLYGTVDYFANFRKDGIAVLHLSTPRHPYSDITGSAFTCPASIYQTFGGNDRDYYAGMYARLVFLHDAPEDGTLHPNVVTHLAELRETLDEALAQIGRLGEGYQRDQHQVDVDRMVIDFTEARATLGACTAWGCLTPASEPGQIYCPACQRTVTPASADA